MVQIFYYYFLFSTRPPPGLLPVLGPLEVVQTPHTCRALPCNSRAGVISLSTYWNDRYTILRQDSNPPGRVKSVITSKPPRLGVWFRYYCQFYLIKVSGTTLCFQLSFTNLILKLHSPRPHLFLIVKLAKFYKICFAHIKISLIFVDFNCFCHPNKSDWNRIIGPSADTRVVKLLKRVCQKCFICFVQDYLGDSLNCRLKDSKFKTVRTI